MNESPLRILLVEDNPGDARLLRELLREAPRLRYELTHVARLEDARAKITESGADLVLLDLSLPDAHGMETVTRMLDAAPEVPIVVLTGLDDETIAMKSVQAGAQDYLVKGHVDGVLLGRTIRYAGERKRLERDRARLLESEREAREIAERAVQARDELLRVVAHDLGNSLSAVVVTTGVLLRTLPESPGDGATRRHIDNIRNLAEQMQRLRQDLLDVARLEAGQLSIDPVALDPCGLVKSSLERYGALAAGKPVSLESRLPDELPAVMGDEGRLLQVVANLLTNAIKFTSAGGRIVLGVEAMDGFVRFFVTDTGTGIPSEHLPHLFDRFWTTREGNPTGAGLGLAIAKGIVEAHGGQIWVDSRVDRGSTFAFTIPTEPVGQKEVS
ncbi:MAG: response regulator [Gemmatimonas sp.]|nr:response regulator [Gemmatimonas sp.]